MLGLGSGPLAEEEEEEEEAAAAASIPLFIQEQQRQLLSDKDSLLLQSTRFSRTPYINNHYSLY